MYDLYIVYYGKNIYLNETSKSEYIAISAVQARPQKPGAVIRRWWDGQIDVLYSQLLTEREAKMIYYRNFGGI